MNFRRKCLSISFSIICLVSALAIAQAQSTQPQSAPASKPPSNQAAAKAAAAKAREEAEQREAVPAGPPPQIASGDAPAPAINAPRIVGATPGRPFLFKIPATGAEPLTYAADALPSGLILDAETGVISGALQGEGSFHVTLTVSGPKGKAVRDLTIVGGTDQLALTPPLGWNSWNAWGRSVTAEHIRAAADSMVKSGLAAHGFQYINIDDAWAGERDANGRIQTNDKFGDIKALADYVHSKGLKLGIYSSPGPRTCAGFEGSYLHELDDAKTYAEWGIDYLKYDWCSYGRIFAETKQTIEDRKAPYIRMKQALGLSGRDIILSVCQYGDGDVWTWGQSVGGNLWRTTYDIRDRWLSMSEKGFATSPIAQYAGPGHWNDPDMLVVGKLGWGPKLHDSRLSPDEQLTHITLWAMAAAPLLIGCDMTQMDQFTTDLLCNDEVLEVDQDPLGKAAVKKYEIPEVRAEVWTRPLSDGTTAVALFNRGKEAAQIAADFAKLGIEGKQPIRDLWRREDLGQFEKSWSASIAPHGARLLKIGVAKRIE